MTTTEATDMTTTEAPTMTEAVPLMTPEATTATLSLKADEVAGAKTNGTFSIREVAPTTIAHEVTNASVVQLGDGAIVKPSVVDSPFSSASGDGEVEATTRNIPRLSVINNSTAITQPKSHKLNVTLHEPEAVHLDRLYQNISSNIDQSKIDMKLSNDTIEDYLDFKDDEVAKSKTPETNEAVVETYHIDAEQPRSRKKRSPQFDGLMNLLGGALSSQPATSVGGEFAGGYGMDDFQVYTKQIPYQKYRQDTFITGLYLAQAVQLAFFFALIVQVSAAVRNRIWMRESGNSTVSKFID